MEIQFDRKNEVLKINWLPYNKSLQVVEYIDEWISIQRHVEIIKPNILYMNMEMFGYRILPEIVLIFNSVTEKLTPQNMVIVKCNDILGSKTLENLLYECPQKGHQIFENNTAGENWLKKRAINY